VRPLPSGAGSPPLGGGSSGASRLRKVLRRDDVLPPSEILPRPTFLDEVNVDPHTDHGSLHRQHRADQQLRGPVVQPERDVLTRFHLSDVDYTSRAEGSSRTGRTRRPWRAILRALLREGRLPRTRKRRKPALRARRGGADAGRLPSLGGARFTDLAARAARVHLTGSNLTAALASCGRPFDLLEQWTGRLRRLRCGFIISPLTSALILAGCASGVLDVSFVAPSTNTDGSPLKDVASYRVYYDTTDAPCPGGRAIIAAAPKVPLPPGQPLGVRLTRLTVGRLYYVAVTAVNSRGIESSCTNTVSARARQP